MNPGFTATHAMSHSAAPTVAQSFPERAMLAWIHDHAPYGVITTDREFRIQTWNGWTEIHSGKKSNEVIGQCLFDLYPDLRARGLEKRFERALEGEISVLSTALHGHLLSMNPQARDCEYAHMQQTARIAPLAYENEIIGTIMVIEDVTEREIQASTLRRQHQRDRILSWALAHLLEAQQPRRTIRELFFKVAEQFDFDAYLLYLLEGSKNCLTLHAAGGISREIEQFVSVLDSSSSLGRAFLRLRDLEGPALSDAAAHAESELSQQLGLRAGAVLPLVTADGLLGALCFGTRTRTALSEGESDLLSTIGKYLALALQKEATSRELSSAQARLNLHAQELEKQVAERTGSLREIIAELETFSYTLAHDLRAPIRALIGYSEALIEDFAGVVPEDGKNIINRLHRACVQLDGLTRDLLEFSRVSRQDIQLAPVDLEEVMSEVISFVPDPQSAIDLRLPLHPVIGHRSSLQQCLANLVDNALKFSKDGARPKVRIWTEVRNAPENPPRIETSTAPFSSARHVEPAITSPQAPFSAALNQAVVRIYVQDEGIGIAEDAHEKIFGIFERGTSSPKYAGNGIGLAIVARAIQRMGGRCGVESTLGVGSRFWLELPPV